MENHFSIRFPKMDVDAILCSLRIASLFYCSRLIAKSERFRRARAVSPRCIVLMACLIFLSDSIQKREEFLLRFCFPPFTVLDMVDMVPIFGYLIV